jgi:adenine-specific DNA-methyltransferase
VVVFRYQKGHITNKTILNGQETEYNVTKGIITFGNNKGQLVSELFDVYVGMVSGKDDVFKQEFGNIEMLTDKNKIEKFVCVSSFPCGEKCIDDHLKMNKDDLLKRKIKKFNENNWFEWGALRNKERTEKNAGKKCIYIKTVTRSNEVAFQDIVQYFGGTLICMIPKKNDVHLNTVVEFLNSETFRKEYMYSGRFKIGQKQLMCLRIPE